MVLSSQGYITPYGIVIPKDFSPEESAFSMELQIPRG
jgi:hypothetical protein